MSFNRPVTIPERQLGAIALAYRQAGLTPPTRTTEILAAINDEPGVNAVALEIARAAFNATETADKFMKVALDKLARAQAADALRAAVGQVKSNVEKGQAPAALSRAVADVAPGFADTVARLTQAAAALDPRKPFDLDAAVRDDTTREMKAARTCLAELSVYAGMHVNRTARNVHPALAAVLPILELPECAVEMIAASIGENPPPLNAEHCAGTYVVRDLTRHLDRDPDAALVAVARGDYAGVTFALGDNLDVRRRAGNAARSDTRKTVTAPPRSSRQRQTA